MSKTTGRFSGLYSATDWRSPLRRAQFRPSEVTGFLGATREWQYFSRGYLSKPNPEFTMSCS